MDKANIVILDIQTYDRFKTAAVKANFVIDQLFDLAQLDSRTGELKFNNSNELSDLLKLAYSERYKNKIEHLKGQSDSIED